MSDMGADPNPQVNKIHTVAFDYGFARQSKIKTDQFPSVTGGKVYTLVQKIGSTRLKVLVNPDEVPG